MKTKWKEDTLSLQTLVSYRKLQKNQQRILNFELKMKRNYSSLCVIASFYLINIKFVSILKENDLDFKNWKLDLPRILTVKKYVLNVIARSYKDRER